MLNDERSDESVIDESTAIGLDGSHTPAKENQLQQCKI